MIVTEGLMIPRFSTKTGFGYLAEGLEGGKRKPLGGRRLINGLNHQEA
jgi:hypothetical protein